MIFVVVMKAGDEGEGNGVDRWQMWRWCVGG